jgi:DNA-binding beta-propeller fold protein YncE
MLVSISVAAQNSRLLESQLNKKRVRLPNGWHLSPAGTTLPLGDLPLNIALSSSKKWMAVTNNGQSVQSLQLINPITEKVVDNVVIPKSWYGLKFSADEKFLYASGGNDNWILKYAVRQQQASVDRQHCAGKGWPEKISPAGIEIDDKANLMYVVTKENNSLYVLDLLTKKTLLQLPLKNEAYACLLSPTKEELYISLWGGDKVLVFNTKTRPSPRKLQ